MSTKRKFSDFQTIPSREGSQGSSDQKQHSMSSPLRQDNNTGNRTKDPPVTTKIKREVVTPPRISPAIHPSKITPAKRLIADHFVSEYQLCKSGDIHIHLRISNSIIRYLVSSETLRLASGVWDAVFDDPIPLSEHPQIQNNKAVATSPFIDLHDDDPEALLVFLRIIHLETDKVPRKLSFSQLRSIALLCDKYDCVRALGLWKELWLEQFNLEQILRPGYEDWLIIDSIFGNRTSFSKLMQTIIKESELGKPMVVGGSRELLRCKNFPGNSSKKDSETYINLTNSNDIPANIIEDIRKHREETIWNLILVARTYLSHLEWKPTANSPPRSYDCWDRCLVMAYGCFARDAQRLGVWRLLFTSRATLKAHPESPAELFEKLRKVQFYRHADHGSRSLESQCPNGIRSCGLDSIQADYEKALQDVLHKLNNIPVDQYLKYKEDRQAKWETIKLPSSFENKMNVALENHGKKDNR